MENLVEKIEIWQKTDEGGEAIEFPSGKHLKLVALLINGHPIKLEEGFYLERGHITKEEAKNYGKLNGI